jgi:hypothetical protein
MFLPGLGCFLKNREEYANLGCSHRVYVPLNPVADLTPAVQVSCVDLSKNHASAVKSASALLNRALANSCTSAMWLSCVGKAHA